LTELLGLTRESLVDVSAAVATRDGDALRRSLGMANRFCPQAEVEEVLLQAHLFVGFPVALEALRLWRTLAPEPAVGGPADDADAWSERGERVCRTIYGRMYDRLRSNVAELHPDFDEWMVVGGYGRVIGRPALSLTTRELCVVGLLVPWDAPRQLHSHARGAVNAGATPDEVIAAAEIGARYLGAEAGDRALDLVRSVVAR
jgi:4-carboxymuconolactone decarboxylase